jgi:hypothetical protein
MMRLWKVDRALFRYFSFGRSTLPQTEFEKVSDGCDVIQADNGLSTLARITPTVCRFVHVPLVPYDYHHSVTIRSAHSTSETKIAGLPNFAPQAPRSASVTPRAREQDPQEKTGMCIVTTFSRSSFRGGQPIGNIAAAVAFRMRYVASPVRKIRTSCPASDNASP